MIEVSIHPMRWRRGLSAGSAVTSSRRNGVPWSDSTIRGRIGDDVLRDEAIANDLEVRLPTSATRK